MEPPAVRQMQAIEVATSAEAIRNIHEGDADPNGPTITAAEVSVMLAAKEYLLTLPTVCG